MGLGVGAGANVLLRFACDNPDRMAGLILANGSAEDAGESRGGGGDKSKDGVGSLARRGG